jgi:hypothetical protein
MQKIRHPKPCLELQKNFESLTTFAPLIEIYLPWNFQYFLMSCSLKVPKRGRCPFKQLMLRGILSRE